MKNAKINQNRTEPNSEEVNKTKDFDFIVKNSKGRQYRILKIAGFIGVAIISFFISKTLPPPKKDKIKTTINQNTSINQIKLPFENLTIPFESFTIDPKIEQAIKVNDGSIINIPKNAFINNGTSIYNDSVILKYRAYKDVPEIFISGIPMTYDSLGTQYHFESAGMFEIKAYDLKGSLLSTNPESLIEVEMTSNNDNPKFNQYYLENDSNWAYKSSLAPYINVLSSSGVTSTNYNKSIEFEKLRLKNKRQIKLAQQKLDSIIKANIPRIPKTAHKDRYALNLKFDTNKFPRLTPFKSVLFEVNPNNPEFNLQEIKANWKDIELTKNDNQYLLILYKNGIKRTIKVTPVISKKDTKNANDIYDKLLNDLKNKEEKLFLKETAFMDSLTKTNKAIEDSIKSLNFVAKTYAYELSEESKNESIVYRVFRIEEFGIYNSDCPTNLPSGITIEHPIFVNKKESNDTLSFNKLFLAEYGSNTIYTLYNTSFKESVSYSSIQETIIWGITKKNKVAVFNFNDYEKDKNLAMKLTAISNVTNLDSIRNILEWQ